LEAVNFFRFALAKLSSRYRFYGGLQQSARLVRFILRKRTLDGPPHLVAYSQNQTFDYFLISMNLPSPSTQMTK
jgi:hypothetical protein